MLNPAGLPDGGTVGIPDHYARGARMTNTTTGQVLRPGLPCRVIRTARCSSTGRSTAPPTATKASVRQQRQPVPLLPRLGRPAVEQAFAVPETRVPHRWTTTQPRPATTASTTPTGFPGASTGRGRGQLASMAGHPVDVAVRHRQIPAVHAPVL